MSQDDQKIIMVCYTTTRLRVPAIPCNRERCQACGAEVWVDATMRHDGCLCMESALREPEKLDFTPHPDVEATLRRYGMSDADIKRASEYGERILRGPRREG